MSMGSLRLCREARGLSQRGLARAADVAFRTVQLLESARHDPRWSTLARLARVLGVEPEELVRGAGGGALGRCSARLAAGGSWKTAFFDFVDDFRTGPCAASVARAPDPELRPELLALLASTVEYLCGRRGLAVPWWCAGVPPLPEPWFVSGTENLKAESLVESPAAFRQRNIFVLGNFLSRC
ncbi:MAG: helix-turn-helix transcriptional regulator [Elusimicrobia bacterium]|nr:helix-turn-helix transcriptional regulator [Elusimicrobiota bacterium]